MLTVPAPDEINGRKLREQLADSGITVRRDEVYLTDGELVFTALGDEHTDAVTAALGEHLTRPDPPPPDEDTQLLAVRAKAQQVAAGEGTFTAAQVQKILAHLILRSTR